ncbi:hypothetical protein BC943DRAFT_322290 [Umbelopsis sp. AD052]|nr:hypothetical protein BC943DRAFT_322290 [Umbelopsis sp. AD052]
MTTNPRPAPFLGQHSFPLLSALLSSSCCVIQLVLNLFSFSCAGFSILTPYRPYLVALTAVSLSYTLFSRGLESKTLGIVLMCLLLMMSPDAVDYYNRTGYFESDTAAITHYLMGIEGMSCMACANRVKQTLETSPLVEEAKIFFQNASAIVTVATTSSTDHHAKHIVELVHNLHDKYSAVILESW